MELTRQPLSRITTLSPKRSASAKDSGRESAFARGSVMGSWSVTTGLGLPGAERGIRTDGALKALSGTFDFSMRVLALSARADEERKLETQRTRRTCRGRKGTRRARYAK